jgi:hypothetical protein
MVDNPFDNLLSGFNLNTNLLIYVFAGAVVFLLGFLLIRKIRTRKLYDTMIEITPRWSLKEEDVIVSKTTPQQTKLQRIFGIKPKEKVFYDTYQSSQTYFVPGAYLFNKNNACYEIRFLDRGKTIVQAVPYKYFESIINNKRFKRRVKFFREGANDYKPVLPVFEGYKEIRNVFDNEASYIQFRTHEEIKEKFKKMNWLMQLLPYIVAIVLCAIMVIGLYLISKNQTEAITSAMSAINENTKAIIEMSKSILAMNK